MKNGLVPGDLLTAQEVAEILGISVNTVRWFGSTGRGPRSILLTPKIRRWRRSDLEEWLEERATEQKAS